ncbi:MAG TPA: carboxylesterase family protein [Caulobacteraceae bacterium]|jgi:para-nitrobenzyl esterase
MRLTGLWAAFALLAVVASATATTTPDRVQVRSGQLQGAVKGSVVVFSGVPYAAPPVGPLRWRAPQPPAAWAGVRSAAQPGPACIQTGGASSYKGAESEDCLTLNVFAPVKRGGGRLPVTVWIHGGGFIGGAGFRYDGTQFAEDGVVLVTLNYRLGRLGFFAHPALAQGSPDGGLANFGLMDQIAALKWVKANIAAFGGDPANVTVFGESAGGQSVNALLVSPLARGLFAKAISESSFGRSPASRLASAKAAAVSYAQSLGVTGEDAQAAAALRALPASAFAKPVANLADPGASRPIVDGVVLIRDPMEAFARGEQARVPLIIGGNSFEASQFASLVAAAPKMVIVALHADPAAAIPTYGGGDPVKAAANLLTLSQVIEADRFMARADARDGTPAYVYYFSYVPADLRSATLGAWHGAEVGYVFDTLPKAPADYPPRPLMSAHVPAATAEDEAVARAMHAAWVAFARTGRPVIPGGPAWLTEGRQRDVLIEFGDDGVRERQDFDKALLDPLAAKAEPAG